MEAVRTVNLTKKYGKITALDNLCLQIEDGELFSLLGVNGAGKTTLIKILSGLIAPTDGDALVLGRSVVRESESIKGLIGVSLQETAIALGLTVFENLEFFCGIYGFRKDESRKRIDKICAELGLSEVLSRKAGSLSGGYQRRLSIAMALIGEPKILFLDEPTLGLDVLARGELWEVIRSLKGRVCIILTTHYIAEAEMLSDRVGIMKDGKLLSVGSPNELLAMTGETSLEGAFVSIVKEAGL